MLCVGIARHGYGAWVQIREDTELGLSEKFYLEEHRVGAKEERTKGGDDSKVAKSPGAVHLVRRANYLLSVLKDKTSNGTNIAAKRAIENHHRNNRKHMGQFHGRFGSPAGPGSPGPTSGRRGDGRSHGHSESRGSISRRDTHGSPNGHYRTSLDNDRSKPRNSEERRPRHQRNDSSSNARNGLHKPRTPADDPMRRIFEPIISNLIRVSGATKKKIPDNDERLKQIKQGLVAIGNHINSEMRHRDDKPHEDKLWNYVSENYWPQSKSAENRVAGDKLRDMYRKINGKDQAKDQAKAASADKVPNGTGGQASIAADGAKISLVPVKAEQS